VDGEDVGLIQATSGKEKLEYLCNQVRRLVAWFYKRKKGWDS